MTCYDCGGQITQIHIDTANEYLQQSETSKLYANLNILVNEIILFTNLEFTLGISETCLRIQKLHQESQNHHHHSQQKIKQLLSTLIGKTKTSVHNVNNSKVDRIQRMFIYFAVQRQSEEILKMCQLLTSCTLHLSFGILIKAGQMSAELNIWWESQKQQNGSLYQEKKIRKI